MKTQKLPLPFYVIEDLADQEAGDLSPGAEQRIAAEVQRVRVQFASEPEVPVQIRHKAHVRIAGWRLEVFKCGNRGTVRAFKGKVRFKCVLSQQQPFRAFLRFAPQGNRGAL